MVPVSPLANPWRALEPDTLAALEELARRLARRLPHAQAAFRRLLRERGCDAARVRALAAITPGAALLMLAAGRPAADFFEEVEYQGRRLAKLNVPPQEALDLLAAYPLPGGGPCRTPVEALRLALALALSNAFYQVRESETQAFYGLFRAEVEADGPEELLRRSIAILTRALRARAGRLITVPAGGFPRRLDRPRYIAGGSADECLVLDAALRGAYACYWSVPFRSGGRTAAVAQFGFDKPYRWLPRELVLLEAAAERALAALERARLVRDLAARELQVRQLAGHLIRAGEEERRRLSRELHDEAGQSMVLLRLRLEALEKAAPDGLRADLAEARQVAERSIAEVRRGIRALSPAVLERLGLPAAVRQLAARFAGTCALAIRLRVPGPWPELPAEVSSTAYRLVQECLQNIAKHARASKVNLSLAPADGWVELSVADNGAGFDVDAALRKPDSFGLAGMRERVALLGGRLEVRSRPGQGTRILARLPLPPAQGRPAAASRGA